VQSRKIKPEPDMAEAVEKTGLLIRGLQSRLLERTGEILEKPVETSADLERQLQEYFTGWPGEGVTGAASLNRIRNRVIDGVAERILRGWEQDGKANPFENEVIERLIDGVLEMLIANGSRSPRKTRNFSPGPKASTTQLQGGHLQA
jgi:hypothetical protein